MVKQEIDRRHTSPQKYHRRDLLSQVLEDMDEENFMNKHMTIHLVLLVLIVKGESISTSLRKSQVVNEILRIENPASGLLRRVVKGIHLKAYLLLQFSLISSFLTEKPLSPFPFLVASFVPHATWLPYQHLNLQFLSLIDNNNIGLVCNICRSRNCYWLCSLGLTGKEINFLSGFVKLA